MIFTKITHPIQIINVILPDVLEPDYLMPPSEEDWYTIADEFDSKWEFPHCIGTLDGKHVRNIAPTDAGSNYYNYKQFNSIVLLAMCDASHKFTIIDVGSCGREGDSAIFHSSELFEQLEEKTLGIPPPSTVLESDKILPFVIVGDEAFPLKSDLMKPFSGRTTGLLPHSVKIFHYRYQCTACSSLFCTNLYVY